MNKIVAIAASTVTLAAVVVMNAGAAQASGGSTSGGWPTAYPLPTNPGTVVSQTSTKVVLRSTDSVAVVKSKLDTLYVTGKGCTVRLAVNKPKDYLCYDPATHKSDEVYFTFAALDPTATDPSASQTTGMYLKG